MVHFSSDETNSKSGDPSTWKAASYSLDPIDVLEPIAEAATSYRRACLDALRKLMAIDEMMTESRDPCRTWLQISIALKLPSSRGYTTADLAKYLCCSEQSLNRGTARIAALLGRLRPLAV